MNPSKQPTAGPIVPKGNKSLSICYDSKYGVFGGINEYCFSLAILAKS
jgi:hypothetical protein